MSLIEKREEAWRKFSDYANLEYKPRYYKAKIGRKMDFINPWKSVEELNMAQATLRKFWLEYLELNTQCYQDGLPSINLGVMFGWKETDTPDGKRWVRTTPEEQGVWVEYANKWSSEPVRSSQSDSNSIIDPGVK